MELSGESPKFLVQTCHVKPFFSWADIPPVPLDDGDEGDKTKPLRRFLRGINECRDPHSRQRSEDRMILLKNGDRIERGDPIVIY